MRSEQVHQALTHGTSRFEVCRLVSAGVRIAHRPGTLMNRSIGEVMAVMATSVDAQRSPGPLLISSRPPVTPVPGGRLARFSLRPVRTS